MSMIGDWRSRAIQAPSRADWLIARQRFVTASDVGTLWGCNPHARPNRVMRDKRGPVRDLRGSSAMRAGGFMEPAVFAWWMDDFRTTQERAGLPAPTGSLVRHPSGASILIGHPDPAVRLAASPDAVVADEAGELVVEIKVHGPRVWGPNGPDGTRGYLEQVFEGHTLRLPDRCWVAPPQYLQVQTQLLCMGLERGCVVRACGTERRDTWFGACKSVQDAIESMATKFWKDMEAQ